MSYLIYTDLISSLLDPRLVDPGSTIRKSERRKGLSISEIFWTKGDGLQMRTSAFWGLEAVRTFCAQGEGSIFGRFVRKSFTDGPLLFYETYIRKQDKFSSGIELETSRSQIRCVTAI